MASIQVSGNASNTMDVTSGSYRGVLISATATTPADLTHTVMKGIKCVVNLYTKEGSYTIHSGSAWPLAIGNNPGNNEGNVSNNYNALAIDWGGIVNLSQGDRLQITLDVSGAATGQVVTAILEPGIGIGYYIPQIQLYKVNLTNTQQDIFAGDNVTKVSVVTDGSSDVITNVNLSSDLTAANYGVPAFRALQSRDYPYAFATGDLIYNLYNGPESQKVNLQISVDTGQTADCFVVSYAGVRTAATTAKAEAIAGKIANEVDARYFRK